MIVPMNLVCATIMLSYCFFLSYSFVIGVASSRDAEQYSLSMELVSGEMPDILALEVK